MSTLWAVKRRFLYSFGLLVAIGAFTALGWWFFFYDQPNCFDGSQNGSETGVDCGGSCKKVCAFEVAPPVVLWSRALEVTSGRYHAIAYLENPNARAGAREITYTFELFDSEGIPVASREGTTYLAPNGITPVFESNIRTGERAPVRTLLSFKVVSDWERTREEGDPFSVRDIRLSNTENSSRLDVLLHNDSVNSFSDIEVIAVILNANKNAIAASRTILNRVMGQSDANLTFTWPQPFQKELEACVVPADVVVLMDVSGSMNDDQSNPPQPLTDALAAAADFVGRLQEGDRVGIVTFATEATVEQELANDFAVAARNVQSLAINPTEEQGGTNIGDAINKARGLLGVADPQQQKKAIVLLTDGRANVPVVPGGELYAAQEGNIAKGDRISVYTIGLGSAVNEAFLRELASDESHYYKAVSRSDLSGIYRQIAASICERGPAIIDILPRSRDVYFTD